MEIIYSVKGKNYTSGRSEKPQSENSNLLNLINFLNSIM